MPGNARILVTPVDLVQPEETLVREKLCPVLAFARVQNIDQAHFCRPLDDAPRRHRPFRRHSLEERRPTSWPSPPPCRRCASPSMPAARLGASGFETNLGPSMTIGTGFVGGSSIGDNLTPHHLVQYARIAYNKDGQPKSSATSTGSIP